MKFVNLLPLAALSTAFVVPAEQVLSEIAIEDHHSSSGWVADTEVVEDHAVSSFKEYFGQLSDATSDAWEAVTKSSKNVWDEAFERASDFAGHFSEDLQSWAETDILDGPPHHGKPGHGRRPRHPPHHHKPNLTVYQLISESKYTTKLAKYISEYDDLVEALNSTKGELHPLRSDRQSIREDSRQGAQAEQGTAQAHPGIPCRGWGEHLSSQPEPQRVAFRLSLRGLTVNFLSKVIAANIFATNGVIHGVDWFIQPPPKALDIIDLLPGEFSTLELGLGKTGLLEKLNTTDHAGGTLFAPSNFAFKLLGPKINAFLFSKWGEKYLKALLEYHVVPKNTLYSDAYYKAKSSDSEVDDNGKGLFHVDLPTLLKDRSLSVDIARFGGFITIRINGFSSVGLSDVIAEDGVIHVVRRVLIPPKKLASGEEYDEDEELTVEDLVERLEPFVSKNDL
ncbi:hypothetical protein MRB53_038374 [Persea americana]|nr:hypothetical protein MRB53_038374 [Persea americana]